MQQKIELEYYISGLLLETQGSEDTDIKIEDIRKEALLKIKDKIGDYLFDNKGFLEELNGKLVFREKAR